MTPQVIRRVLGIPYKQQRATGLLFAYSFLTSASYVAARTTGDSLFLSQRGVAELPQAFLLSSLAVATTAIIVNRLGQSTKIVRVARVTRIVLMAITLLFTWLDGMSQTKFLAVSVLYILAEVRGCLNTMQMTSLLTEVFRNRRAKSIYAVIGAGAPLAGCCAGLLMGLEAADIGGRSWLLFICLLDLLALIPLTIRFRNARSATETSGLSAVPLSHDVPDRVLTADRKLVASEQSRMFSSVEETDVVQYRYLLPLIVLVASKVVVLTLINYQWKALAAVHFHNNEQQLTAYFAAYYAVANIVILGFQMFLTGRFLERIGTVVSLILFPVLAGLTGLGLLQSWVRVTPITAITLARATDVYRRAVHDTSMTGLYAPLDVQHQRRFNAIINGLVKPAAEASASILLTITAAILATLEITVVWMCILPIWLGSVFVLGRQYRQLRHPEKLTGPATEP